MKKIISVFLMAAMLFCFAACTPVSEDSIEPAVYRMFESKRYPHLSIRDDGTFALVHNAVATDTTSGTYTVEEKVLKLTAEDGSVYCFDIKRKGIEFNAELSDEFISTPDIEYEIVDGTEFYLWRKLETKS